MKSDIARSDPIILETNKIIISEPEFLDYLFHRLFTLIQMLLRRTNRGG